eukprot:1418919-Amphidinium_carterae.1
MGAGLGGFQLLPRCIVKSAATCCIRKSEEEWDELPISECYFEFGKGAQDEVFGLLSSDTEQLFIQSLGTKSTHHAVPVGHVHWSAIRMLTCQATLCETPRKAEPAAMKLLQAAVATLKRLGCW